MNQNDDLKKKHLAILKAQNQMLEEAKESINKTTKIDDVEKEFINKQVDVAINDNLKLALTEYNATEDDLKKIKYKDASPYFVEKYNERLKLKGVTDEELHSKTLETKAYVAEKDNTNTSRRRKGRKKSDNDVNLTQNVELEQELMRKTYIDKDRTEDEVLNNNKDDYYDFDFSTIPDYVQYDVIPLPSRGECYKHKIGRIPVAYLTASDENILASPNMYRDGKIMDVILERKILDKRIKPYELCKGDRDAIILWLRATGYGPTFPITATHPSSGKKYSVNLDLSTLKYLPFNIHADKDGLFEFQTNNNIFKFKILSYKEEEELKKEIINDKIKINAFNAIKYLNNLTESMTELNDLNDIDKKDANDCIADLKDIIVENYNVNNINNEYEEVITKQMIKHTVSINGNTDIDFITNTIINMRAKDAYAYRMFMFNNKPGIDFNITINIPESDGGGSFDTFLTTDDTIFLNV